MRNLKKFLALVLAMMMVFSLMITANATVGNANKTAKMGESVTEEFQEAIDVTVGMGILKGYEDGTFKPQNKITRAEMTALVYRLTTGDAADSRNKIYSTYIDDFNLTDIYSNDWYSGYVGYCANAEFIKGYEDKTFKPGNDVTGYEALAMLLRALKTGKAYTGSTWKVDVAARATQLRMLTNINNTNYAGTLNQPATRELVAEMVFQAANIRMDEYDGANTMTNIIYGGADAKDAKDTYTLGEVYYGLTYGEGIIVSNQGTGDDKTVWRTTARAQDSQPLYFRGNTAAADPVPAITAHVDINLNWESGLKDFGHNYKVWYNRTMSDNKTVYAAYDKVVKTQMVLVNEDNTDFWGSLTTDTKRNALGDAAKQVGFVLNDEGKAFFSASFLKFDEVAQATANSRNKHGNAVAWGSGVRNPGHNTSLYLLISNDLDNTLNAVVTLNVESSAISQIDNVSAVTSIKLPTALQTGDSSANVTTMPAQNKGRFLAPNTNSTISDVLVNNKIQINQKNLTSNSTKTLGDYVVSMAIGVSGNNANTAIKNYNVSKIVDTKVGQVVSYNTTTYNYTPGSPSSSFDSNDRFKGNTNPDTVTLADGTVLEKSLLYYTVQNDKRVSATSWYSIPQVDYLQPDGQALTPWTQDRYANITYKFYLDSDGRYIGAEPVRGEKFIYGTYVDYSQETSSSSFKYFMTGVDADGKIVTEQFNTWRGTPMVNNNMRLMLTNYHNFGIDNASAVTGLGRTRISYTGLGAVVAGDASGNFAWNRYNGFMLTSTGAMYDDVTTAGATATTPNTCVPMSPERYGYYKLTEDTTARRVTVDKAGVTTGAVLASSDPDANGTATGATSLYLTENTKFIVVSGAGTDTVRSEVFNGITEFLGDSTSVSFPVFVDNEVGVSGTKFADSDTFYTVDVNWYANVDNRYSNGIDTIFLNKSIIDRVGTDGILFLPSTTALNVDAYNNNYKLLTFYQGDKAVNYWIDFNGPAVSNTSFYNQLNAVAITSTGETVYQVGARMTVEDEENLPAHTSHTNIVHGTDAARTLAGYCDSSSIANVAGVLYVPTTLNARTAEIGAAKNLFNISNAKVVNLIPAKLPGVSDIASLNEAASNLTGVGRNVYVHFVTESNSSNVITTIYVTDVTNP